MSNPRFALLTAALVALSVGVPTARGELIAHWTFDNDGSDAVGTYDGSIAGDAFISAGGGGVAGESLVLDGDGDYWILDLATSDFNLSTFSVSVWYRGPINQRGHYILLDLHHGCCHGPHPHGWVSQGHIPSSGLGLGGYTQTGTTFGTGHPDANSLLDDNWHHLVGSYAEGEELNVYFDGELVATQPLAGITSPAYDGDAPLTIGRLGAATLEGLPANDRDFLGRIDDVRIYDHALELSEVQYLYNSTLLTGIPTLSAWGLVAMALLVLAAGTVVLLRRRLACVAG